VFLLADDGARQVRANLAFMTGALAVRERTSFRYDAIVSVRVEHDARRGQKFELRLAAGEPIIVQVRDPDPADTKQGQVTEPADETDESAETQEDPVVEAASVANTMLVLEGVAAEGRNWFYGRD
jgi:hypothetical protein